MVAQRLPTVASTEWVVAPLALHSVFRNGASWVVPYYYPELDVVGASGSLVDFPHAGRSSPVVPTSVLSEGGMPTADRE